jgi:cation diffusion facilitator family transporter
MLLKDGYSEEEKRKQVDQVRLVSWAGVAVNLFLSLVKFIAGYLGSSQAVIADAVHSLSDMTTDLAVIFGVRYWVAPADEKHPYGHGRIETIITATIGMILTAVALGIGYKAISTIRDVHLKQPGWIALLGALFSIMLNEGLYHWTVRIGKRAKSTAVIANAWHHRSDALSSIPAVIAVALAIMSPKLAFIDHIGALIVSVFILKVSWDIVYPAFLELSDSGASRKELDQIESIARGVTGVQLVEAIRTRRCGDGIFVDLHVQVEGEMSVREGHNIAGAVKGNLMEKGPNVHDVIVHIEPFEQDSELDKV